MGDILGTCRRFAGLIERWGGDIVPELLLDGDERGDVAKDRATAVQAIHEVRTQRCPIADACRPSRSSSRISSGSCWNLRTRLRARTPLLALQDSRSPAQRGRSIFQGRCPDKSASEPLKRVGHSRAEANRTARRWRPRLPWVGMSNSVSAPTWPDCELIKAVLLRLDFNGVLSDRIGLESEGATGVDVLA